MGVRVSPAPRRDDERMTDMSMHNMPGARPRMYAPPKATTSPVPPMARMMPSDQTQSPMAKARAKGKELAKAWVAAWSARARSPAPVDLATRAVAAAPRPRKRA